MAEINPFTRGIGSGTDLVPVTPNDSADLSIAGRAIRCRPDGVAGTLRFRVNDGTVRDTYIGAGDTIIVGVIRVHASGTTATKLEIYV